MTAPVPAYAAGDWDAFGWSLTVRRRDMERWRRIVADRLRTWGAPRSSVELAHFGVSELLANVDAHAGDPHCRLRVERDGTKVVVSVFDRCSALPEIGRPDWAAESGRGLWLLQQMTGREGLGFERAGPPWAKVVWFRCGLVDVEQKDAT